MDLQQNKLQYQCKSNQNYQELHQFSVENIIYALDTPDDQIVELKHLHTLSDDSLSRPLIELLSDAVRRLSYLLLQNRDSPRGRLEVRDGLAGGG